MTYGHFYTSTSGEKRWITEGCSYCSLSTGGQHTNDCPFKPSQYEHPQIINKIPNIRAIKE